MFAVSRSAIGAGEATETVTAGDDYLTDIGETGSSCGEV